MFDLFLKGEEEIIAFIIEKAGNPFFI